MKTFIIYITSFLGPYARKRIQAIVYTFKYYNNFDQKKKKNYNN